MIYEEIFGFENARKMSSPVPDLAMDDPLWELSPASSTSASMLNKVEADSLTAELLGDVPISKPLSVPALSFDSETMENLIEFARQQQEHCAQETQANDLHKRAREQRRQAYLARMRETYGGN